MQGSQILEKDFYKNTTDYASQWEQLKNESPGLQKILKDIETPGHAIVFGHDDPDGITSGLILYRMLLKKGWKAVLINPEQFNLSQAQLDEALKNNPGATALFIADKGTSAAYDELKTNLPVYLVDHHPTPKVPEKCTWFNPAAHAYIQCSGSILAHGISFLAGTRDEYDDFLCLVGLKGDWAIEPVTGHAAEFTKPFLAKYGLHFSNMLKNLNERPTMFDSTQREKTCLLSRVAEYVHACGGGGFSYFYHDREEALKNVNHAKTVADALLAIENKAEQLKKIATLNEFTALLPEKEGKLLEKIWGWFLKDWDTANKLMDSSALSLRLHDTDIFLFTGPKVPLLPMIGSIKLAELKTEYNSPQAQIIMVSRVDKNYTHVSVRATGINVHSGKFCGYLQDSSREKYPQHKDAISGGGHPVAAECTFRTPEIPFLTVLSRVTNQLCEMNRLDNLAKKTALTAEQKETAAKLGLDYLKN
ncbi:MAG: hypothetical protein GX221_09395 [Candidatus Riflebacteria bacterium]|nr:hypothetical protein [Candidatus Riflebacteria bacterium]